MGGEAVGEELGDDGGFGDDLVGQDPVGVFDARHESALWCVSSGYEGGGGGGCV